MDGEDKAWELVERLVASWLWPKSFYFIWTHCWDFIKCVRVLSSLMAMEVIFSIKNGNITRISDPKREILPEFYSAQLS